jgi:hypothetical protein
MNSPTKSPIYVREFIARQDAISAILNRIEAVAEVVARDGQAARLSHDDIRELARSVAADSMTIYHYQQDRRLGLDHRHGWLEPGAGELDSPIAILARCHGDLAALVGLETATANILGVYSATVDRTLAGRAAR